MSCCDYDITVFTLHCTEIDFKCVVFDSQTLIRLGLNIQIYTHACYGPSFKGTRTCTLFHSNLSIYRQITSHEKYGAVSEVSKLM